jgi:DNA-binding response OmpR family regulator
MNKKILIIEDDRDLVDLLAIHLADLEYTLDKAYDGEKGLELIRSNVYDLVILDLMLPKLDGLEVCKKIRSFNKTLSILMLTSRSEEIDKILGLELGADDYVTKPFSIRELMARIKSIIRRVDAVKETEVEHDRELMFDMMKIDLHKRKVTIDQELIELTAKEFELLSLFASNPGRSFSREQLLNQIWGYQYLGYEHTVNSHINRLRQKIEKNPSEPRFIKTVWGVGYRFTELEELEK